MFTIVGLGNPDDHHRGTRHNVGRIIVDVLQKRANFSDWEHDKKLKALVSKGTFEKTKVILLKPETYMNKSGHSVKPLITSEKKAENLIVVYDDLDLPLGKIKIVFDRGSGGHKGLESIIKSIRTKKFARVRIGISPVTSKGKIKKPSGEETVSAFILGTFSKKELEIIKKISKNAAEAIEHIIVEGLSKTMNTFNART